MYANLANFRILFKSLGGFVALDKVDASHKTSAKRKQSKSRYHLNLMLYTVISYHNTYLKHLKNACNKNSHVKVYEIDSIFYVFVYEQISFVSHISKT